MLRHPTVQRLQQFPDGLVELGEGEETAVTQARQDPSLDQLDADLDLGFVARLAWPRRYDRGVVMGRQIGVSAVDLGIVQAGLDDAGLQIIRHDLGRHAVKIGKGAGVGADPVGQALRPGRFRISVAGGSQSGDEDLGFVDLAALRVDHLGRGAGVIDEHLLAGHMALAHGYVELAFPSPIARAELAVAITIRVDGAVFFPQQRQGDAGPLEFAMQRRPVGGRASPRINNRRRREQQAIQIFVRKTLGQRPAQTGALGAANIVSDRRAADSQTGGDPPLRQSPSMQPQNITYLAHGQSLPGHPRSSWKRREGNPSKDHPTSAITDPFRLAVLRRNRWPD